jgi:hypothetical protein
MFRTSYVHCQEDYIKHAVLYSMYSMHGKHTIQYSLSDDEHKMFKTCRRQEELN